MRSLALIAVSALCATRAAAGSFIGGLAGTIDNAAQAASLQTAAQVLTGGAYTITNAATGKSLTYDPNGNHIVPASGAGTPVNVLAYGGGVSWVRLQIGEKDKCLSSQWGGSYNLAGVMYSCAVDSGGDVTRQDNTLEPTKQWWLMVPVDDHSGDSDASNHVLLAAQDESVATREKAIKNGIEAHFKKNNRRSPHPTSSIFDMNPRRFELVSRAKRTRQDWRVRSKQDAMKKKKQQQQQQQQKKNKAAKAKPKPSSSSAKKAKKASSKKAVTAKKATNSNSKVQQKLKNSGSGGDLANVKLNVAIPSSKKSSNRFFIIPVDHLIDMHTLALTGHEIESFRAQSTALDLWDSSDEYQQWIVEPTK
ncbi:hypothetical protein JCM10213_002031 [Rhodosporidiobolus nylandii]